MVDKTVNLLPEVPDSFCFSSIEFSANEFEVDQFIKKHQNNMPLEQLREDLSIYLRKLRLSLVDLINCDYEEFIHLTSNYIDLNNNINNLLYSLSKLKRDVEQSSRAIESTIDKLNENLDYVRLTLKQKNDLYFILKAVKMIDSIEADLQRMKANDRRNLDFIKVAYQLNQINQKLNKLSLNSSFVNQTFKSKVDDLNEELNDYLDRKVQQYIDESNSEGLNDLLESSILNQQSDQFVELVFAKVFKRSIQAFICDLNVDKCGIASFYEQLFDICDNGLKRFSDVNAAGIHLTDNLVDCISEKIYNDLTINASTLFLAGNPETFILNFKETIKFFSRLLALNSTGKPAEQFRIFNEIKRKFNCEIYFHIRLSQVSNELSKALARPIRIENDQPNQFNQPTIKIQLIDDLLGILNFIWSDQIYLNTLFFDFWRLTMLLVSRYTLFLKQFQSMMQSMPADHQSNILICLINESSLLVNSIQQIYSTAIKPKIPSNCNEFELMNCLNQSFETMFVIGLPTINGLLKQVFCVQCLTILEQIKEIPRLYRKTNRDVPSRPSSYIVNCIGQFQQLKQIQKCSSNLILDILNEVTNNFYSLTHEVLESLQKMEESLMRLKKVQTTANGNLKSLDKRSSTSDADKIRLQFKLDVNFYVQNVSLFACITQ